MCLTWGALAWSVVAGKVVRMQHRRSTEVAANRVMSKRVDGRS